VNLPTQHIVSEVLRLTRQKFWLGSGNKFPSKDPRTSKKLAAIRQRGIPVFTHDVRIAMAAPHIGPARNTINQLRITGAFTKWQAPHNEMVNAFDNFAGGNCFDMALYAFGLFGKWDVYPLERIDVQGGDHSYVVVGRFDSFEGTKCNLQDLGTWGESAYVCDPWANIACRASDYLERWNIKMSKWQDAGKLIGYWDGPTDNPANYKKIQAREEFNAPINQAYTKVSNDRTLPGSQVRLYLFGGGARIELVHPSWLWSAKTSGINSNFTGVAYNQFGIVTVAEHVNNKTCLLYQWDQPVNPVKVDLEWDLEISECADIIRKHCFPGVQAPKKDLKLKTVQNLQTYIDALYRM
jgi:hypothetical protein